MRIAKRILLIAIIAAVLCGQALAAGSVTITYNNGGSIQAAGEVSIEGNVIYVDSDNPVELLVTPDEGYEIYGVYLNDQSMSVSGAGQKTVSVNPNGSDVRVRVTFVKSEVVSAIEPSSGETETGSPQAGTPAPVTPEPGPSVQTGDNSSGQTQTTTPKPAAPAENTQTAESEADPVEPEASPEPSSDATSDESEPDDISDGSEENASDEEISGKTEISGEDISDGNLGAIGTSISNDGVGGVSTGDDTNGFLSVAVIIAACLVGAAVAVIIVKRLLR